eukprot:4172821-Prymnesium_polylepis.1
MQGARAIWQAAGMRYKVKALVGFYQCVAAAPSVFDVQPPVGLEEYSKWTILLELPSELENVFIATSCLGNYHRRVLLGSLWPGGLVLLFALGFVGWDFLRRCSRGDRTPQSSVATVKAGLQRVLPMTLAITFVVVPSTSMRIFRTFVCEPVEYGNGETRRYLKADLSYLCNSDEYEEARSTAFLFIAVWPVGIPVLYMVLLLASRRALVKGVPTPLTRATAFLSGDYTENAFYWEPLEMCRKLTLTGW